MTITNSIAIAVQSWRRRCASSRRWRVALERRTASAARAKRRCRAIAARHAGSPAVVRYADRRGRGIDRPVRQTVAAHRRRSDPGVDAGLGPSPWAAQRCWPSQNGCTTPIPRRGAAIMLGRGRSRRTLARARDRHPGGPVVTQRLLRTTGKESSPSSLVAGRRGRLCHRRRSCRLLLRDRRAARPGRRLSSVGVSSASESSRRRAGGFMISPGRSGHCASRAAGRLCSSAWRARPGASHTTG